MAKLIHLNGPPGVGKSTLAARYVDDHRGALNLDVDLVVGQIGGWRDNFWDTIPMARRLAAAMARQHLDDGHDVVLPQLTTGLDESEPYESAARSVGGEYREVVLFADLTPAITRFSTRQGDFATDVQAHVHQLVERSGGVTLLSKIYRQLVAYLSERPDAIVLQTGSSTPADSYQQLLRALPEDEPISNS